MKKTITAIAVAGMIAMPAFAASITVSFANDDGTTSVWTFDDETNMATTADGIEAPYTFDAEAMTLCAEIPEAGEVCATFESAGEAVGDTSRYTLSSGGGGLATLTAMSE